MAEFDVGRWIDKYRVVRIIGQGGMGTVYEVEHVGLGVRYALKAFSFAGAEADAEMLRTKFLEEGRLLARLDHPNLMHVHDLGIDPETQTPYFVMDLVLYSDGEAYTVEDVDPADITEPIVARWFGELASALDYIHAQGVVHRDIKPSNLLLDKDLHVILSDFGISRVFGCRMKVDLNAAETMTTRTGRGKLVLGTAKYMAPEVALGAEATPEADAYSLGVMVLRWLTGFFYKDNPGALDLLVDRNLPWREVLSPLLAPLPGRRPARYAELARRLVPAPRGAVKPTAGARQTSRKADARRNVLSAALASAGVSLLFLALIGGLLYAGYRGWRKWDAEHQAHLKTLAEMEARLAKRPVIVTNVLEVPAPSPANTVPPAPEDHPAEAPVPMEGPSAEAPVAIEEPPSEAPAAEPPPSVVRNDVPSVSEEPEEVFGPIPDRTYRWFDGRDDASPRTNRFLLANGAAIDLLPFRKGSFLMSNLPGMGTAYHKVTFSRPFWVSRLQITVEQLRDLDPASFNDSLPIEKALEGTGAAVYKNMPVSALESYCRRLTRKYGRQLPDGYVFRLPTEAELEHASNWRATLHLYGEKAVDFCSQNQGLAPEAFAKLRSRNRLDAFGTWTSEGYIEKFAIQIGGLSRPHASGVQDLHAWYQFTLDRVPNQPPPASHPWFKTLRYVEEETDPLVWCAEGGLQSVRRWEARDFGYGLPLRAHVVLGPDLVAEGRWKTRPQPLARNVRVPPRNLAWPTPAKISRPDVRRFNLACGEVMEFCYCPPGAFEMSSGRARQTHHVELTRPFWMTRFCVTAKQWREFGRYDCEGDCRLLEAAFPHHPVCPAFNRWNWEAFCAYLNRHYGAQLPKGYVFRLPTEAEWEWALVADRKHTVWDVDEAQNASAAILQEKFKKLWKRSGIQKKLGKLECHPTGVLSSYGTSFGTCFVGGRTVASCFGVQDLIVPGTGHDVLMLDTLDWIPYTGDADWHVWRPYEPRERDPLAWAGALGTHSLLRIAEVRRLHHFDLPSFAHLVIGPDLTAVARKVAAEPYPESDFGGHLISPECRVSGVSSLLDAGVRHDDWLLSSAPIPQGRRETRAFHTRNEDTPWVEIDLGKDRRLTGLVLEDWGDADGAGCGRSVPLLVKLSSRTGGDEWKVVHRETRGRRHYRIDLARLNASGCRLRLERESDGVEGGEPFHLQRVMIYAKP